MVQERSDTESAVSGAGFRAIFSVHGYADDEGRLLGEHRAEREGHKGPPTTHAQCPYPGSRHKHERPMNVSALKQMAEHWEDIVDTLEFLRAEGRRDAGGAPPSLADLWKLLVAGTSLPSFLLLRTRSPLASGQLPSAISAAYKVILGMKYTVEELALTTLLGGGRVLDVRPTGPLLFDYADSHGLLVGDEEVCAGPNKSIQEALGAVVEGRTRKRAQGDLAIERVLDDHAAWLRFAQAAGELFVVLLLFLTEANRLQGELDSALGRKPAGRDEIEFGEDGPEASVVMTLGLKRICWMLAWHGDAIRTAGYEAYCGLAGVDGSTPRSRTVLAVARAEESEAAVSNQIARLLAEAPEVGCPRDAIPSVARLASAYLQLERRTLRALTEVEVALNDALGRTSPKGRPEGRDIEGYCGNTMMAKLQRDLGPAIAIERGGDATVLRCGSQSVSIG